MRRASGSTAFDNPAWAYVAPFAVLVLFLMAARLLPPGISYGLRTAAVAAAILMWARPALRARPSAPFGSVLAGAAVFAVWIGPDLMWPGYHGHWLFRNALTGETAAPAFPHGIAFVALRALGSALVVPPAEELFWRGWLMRWLISPRFDKVPFGAFRPGAFVLTAVLFAAEHGPYWDVGLAAGIVYNFWMVKTRNLADCILAHAVTNGCLAAYVILEGRWEFWL